MDSRIASSTGLIPIPAFSALVVSSTQLDRGVFAAFIHEVLLILKKLKFFIRNSFFFHPFRNLSRGN